MIDKKLHLRLLKLLFDHKEEHVGSCFSCVDIIDDIFLKKGANDLFILSNGHAAYALYAVIEKYHGIDADKLVAKHGGHPNWDESNHIHCSTGSLGSGISIAVGRALSNSDRKIYVMISDGECAEGSVWESLRFIHENGLGNVEVHVNANGYACYDVVNVSYLRDRLESFLPSICFHNTRVDRFPFLNGLDAHYKKISEQEYADAIKILDNER